MGSLKQFVDRFPGISRKLRAWKAASRRKKAPVQTPHGFLFRGRADMESGAFESDEVTLVKRLLEDTDVLVNIGANAGYYVCLALARQKEVIAFEPVASNLEALFDNLRVNGWEKNAEVFPVALGDAVGVVDFYGEGVMASMVPGWGGWSSSYKTTVPVNRLDHVLGRRLADRRVLFLVDVEGAELAVLRGAAMQLSGETPPVWLVEIASHEHQPEGTATNPSFRETMSIFRTAGYAIWSVCGDPFLLEEPMEEEVLSGKRVAGPNYLMTKVGLPSGFPAV